MGPDDRNACGWLDKSAAKTAFRYFRQTARFGRYFRTVNGIAGQTASTWGGVLSVRAKPISVKWNLGRAVYRQEPFITTINIHHILQTSIVSGTGFCLFRTDTVSSGRIFSLPDGYHLFRTGSVYTERMLDIRGVSGISI